MKWFYIMIKIIFFVPIRLLFPLKVIGKKRLPKGQKYVSITNHLGMIDVIMLAFNLSGFRYYLAKKELEQKFFLGRFLKNMGAIYIDRHNLDLKGIKKAIAGLKKAPLSIFPEGTRNYQNEQIQQVKGGAAMIAAKSDVCIVPIMIHHRSKVFRRNYLFVGEAFSLPYTSKDRFNTETMNICTAIISERMLEAKATLDNLIATKTYKQYNKQVNKKYKANKKNKSTFVANVAKNGEQENTIISDCNASTGSDAVASISDKSSNEG